MRMPAVRLLNTICCRTSRSNNMPVVIVTGSSSGIGRGTAAHFAKKGWRVVLTGRNEAKLKEAVQECIKAGGKAEDLAYVAGDINSAAVAKQLVDTAVRKFGRLDSLINNHGVVNQNLVENAPLEELDFVFNTNAKSVVQLTKLAIPYLKASKGTIVNVSSIASLVSQVTCCYYSMSKCALDCFTKILALELAPHGVRVNSVNPAFVETGLIDTLGLSKEQRAEIIAGAKNGHALGRTGKVSEVAKAIFFLAGPHSSFTTGDILKVDGGAVLLRP